MSDQEATPPGVQRWKQLGAITFALGVLAALMVQAGVSTGCKSSTSPGPSGEPSSLAAAPGEPPGSKDEGKAAAPSASAEDDEEYFMPASKAGPVYRPRKTSPPPGPTAAPQASKPGS